MWVSHNSRAKVDSEGGEDAFLEVSAKEGAFLKKGIEVHRVKLINIGKVGGKHAGL